MNLESMIGERFGRLVVLSDTGRRNRDRRPLLRCLCDCGQEKEVSVKDLKDGSAKSCGCYKVARAKAQAHDLTGLVVGRLTVLQRAESTGAPRWLCRCECGGEKVVSANQLSMGKTLSCGCLRVEIVRKRNTKHGGHSDPEYIVWKGMMQRCSNQTCESYRSYGGMGVVVCDRWKDYANFLADMGRRPEGYTLERRRVEEGYGPDNCYWAERKTQDRNRRNTIRLTHDGVTQSLLDWSDSLGIPHARIRRRLMMGWSHGEALGLVHRKKRATPMVAPEDPERKQKHLARLAFTVARNSGRIKPAAHCQHPGCQETRVEGHHHNGYGPGHELDVVWLCREHHPREWSIKITAFGETLTLKEWAKRSGLSKRAIRGRLHLGWSPEESVSIPKGQKRPP